MATFEVISDRIPVSMHDDWFEIANTEHFWMQWRFGVLKKLLIKNNIILGKDHLEIGCGSGTFRQQFETTFGLSLDGCDLNSDALNYAEQGLGKLMQYNIFDKNKDLLNKYDSIFLMDVLEHLSDDVSFLKTATMHGKPGSLVFINVPAGMYLYSKYDIEVGHVRRYNKKMLNELMIKSGVIPLTTIYWAFSLIPIGILRKIILSFYSGENIIKEGFKPPGNFSHKVLKTIKNVELSMPFNPPIGASLFAIGKIV